MEFIVARTLSLYKLASRTKIILKNNVTYNVSYVDFDVLQLFFFLWRQNFFGLVEYYKLFASIF